MGENKDDVWGVKASPEICDILDDLFEKSGHATKKDYLEHLTRLYKANHILAGTEKALR